jgi:adenine-specific DNA-methyltransferase
MLSNKYINNRLKTFNQIRGIFSESASFCNDKAILVKGDSIEELKKIPDKSISLILTDPPYHTTKKKNITNDTAFKDDEEFLGWIEKYMNEWYRILRPNGSIYVFCSSIMSARIEVLMTSQFNILSNIIWTKPNDPGFDGWKQKMKKESLRQWYDHSERIIFAEPAYDGNLNKSSFGNFLRDVRLKSGLSSNQLTELVGAYGKINHGGAVNNWESGRNVPSREQYAKISQAILSKGKVTEMPSYEDVIRQFDVNSNVEFTDIWNFYSVRPYNGKHPAEKPIEMLEHCILSSSYEGDIVLDCFAGSGSSAIAALTTGRLSISIDIDELWIEAIKNRLESFFKQEKVQVKQKHDIMKVTKVKTDQVSPTLF